MDDIHSAWAGRDERVFEYLPLERASLQGLAPGSRVLDLGCGDGSHMPVLGTGGRVFGMDVAASSLGPAGRFGPVAAGLGERLPFASGAFGLVYVSHVLHHAERPRDVLAEIRRVLAPGGTLVLVETCEDSPIMRLARAIRPNWESVPVRSRFRYAELVAAVHAEGFEVDATDRFNVLYWIWGFARRGLPFLERHVRTAVRLELAAVKRLRRFSEYGYVVARAPVSDQGAVARTTADASEGPA